MVKLTLQHVKGNSYFFSGVLSIGVYVSGDKAILIDSGGDENCAKNVMLIIQEAGYEIGAIINTHCHPDHCGGNAYFQKKFPDLLIYATKDEQSFIEDPLLAPRCFCSLAAPFKGLQNKYIAPQKSSQITNVIYPYQDQDISIHNANFNIVTLPGHTPGMIGIITPDNILYCGDALFGKDTITKHPVLFYTDIEKTLLSFEKIYSLTIDGCVLGHGGFIDNVKEVIEQHKSNILEIKDTLFSFLMHQPLSIDEITQKVMQKFDIMDSMISFTLTQTTVRAYLTALENENKIQLIVSNGLLRAVIK